MRKIILPIIMLLATAQAADAPFYIKEWAHQNNKYIINGKFVNAPAAKKTAVVKKLTAIKKPAAAKKPAAPKRVAAAPRRAPAARTPSRRPTPVRRASPTPTVRVASHTRTSVHDVTFYQALSGQTDSTPNLSACGRNKGPWAQVAASRDMFRSKYKCGQLVRITLSRPVAGVKTFTAQIFDTMNPRFTNRIDVLVGPNEPAMRYGKTTATVTKLN